MLQRAEDWAGFSDPVHDKQRVFRAILAALSRPGEIVAVRTQIRPPRPLSLGPAAVALCLFDEDTAVWLDETCMREAVLDFLRFCTGAPVTEEPGEAVFGLVGDPCAMPPLPSFAQGDLCRPDRSTTLVLQIESLVDGDPVAIVGPGIADRVSIAPQGLPAGFWDQWGSNADGFPCGVDVLLASGSDILGLPRTVRLA